MTQQATQHQYQYLQVHATVESPSTLLAPLGSVGSSHHLCCTYK